MTQQDSGDAPNDGRLDREGALELLRSQHTFPGLYTFRVVVRPDARSGVVSAIAAALGDASAVQKIEERASRKGNYLSLHVITQMEDAEGVLDVYEVVGALDEVLMTL
jgi:putative lipoic acid-binding regulatory protein